MDWLGILFALGLPAALGILVVGLIVPAGAMSRTPLVIGYGLITGLIAVTLLMRLLDFLGFALSPASIFSAAMIAALPLIAYATFGPPRAVSGADTPAGWAAGRGVENLLAGFLLCLIVLRVSLLAMEIYLRPVYPFDATMHWATKARVWFELAQIAPFVENGQWLRVGGDGVYTDHHPDYPATIPLLQAWMSLALGRWSESLINLPWLLGFVGLGFAFFAQARQAGSTPAAALVFTYLLLSMPLLNTHVALAGYADLFLGIGYCLAVMAFYNWSVGRQRWQLVLAALMAGACPLIKNEGFFWLLTFLPGLVVVFLPARQVVILLSAGLLSLGLVLLVLPGDMVIAGHSLEQLNLHFRPEALGGLRDSLLVGDSWHLFPYLLLGLVVLAAFRPGPAMENLSAIALVLASALVLFLVLFLFTKYAGGATRLTAGGRISLHLAPALLFFCLLLYGRLARNTTGESASDAS